MNQSKVVVVGSITKHLPRAFRIGVALATLSIAVARPARATTFSDGSTITVTNTRDTSYAQACFDAGVPLPANWGSDSTHPNLWTSNGRFTDGYAANSLSSGTIWYQTQANGLCVIVAHDIQGSGTTPNAFDVICQSTAGKACFWEGTQAPSPPTNRQVVLASRTTSTSFVAGGTDLANKCTGCHIGENAFISHGGSHKTNLTGKVGWMPSNWYDPIVAATFPKNPPPGNYARFPGSSACLGCHVKAVAGRLPDVPLAANDNASAGQQFCDILDQVTNRSDATGGMPLGINCTPFTNCSQTEQFPKTLLKLCRESNIAVGRASGQSSTYLDAAASRANDGNVDGDYAHGSVSHTGNVMDHQTWNDMPFAGSWLLDGTIQDAFSTLTVNGQTAYGIDRFGSNPFGLVRVYSVATDSWTSTGGSMAEISVSGNPSNGALFGIQSSKMFQFTPPTTWTTMDAKFLASHVSAGDGVFPWAVSSDGVYLAQYGGSIFQPNVVTPWLPLNALHNSNTKFAKVAVGADGDAWALDTSGNVYHQRGGPNPNSSYFLAGLDWELVTPVYGGSTAQVTSISVTSAYNVWVAGASPLGLFNFNPSTHAWQHHCPTSGCTTLNSRFKSVSAGVNDGGVWAITQSGDVYHVDQSLLVTPDASSTYNSLVPGGATGTAFDQIVGGGGASDHHAWAVQNLASLGGGTVSQLSNYLGATPIAGGPFWFVDLGGFFHVDLVKIFNRTDCCADRLSKFRILYWTGTSWVTGSEQSTRVVDATTPVLPIDVSFNTELVMIQKTNWGGSNDYLSLAEVQVFGTPATQF